MRPPVLLGVLAVVLVACVLTFALSVTVVAFVAVRVSAKPTPTPAGGTVGNRWKSWHGLPLPEYFQLQQEQPARNPFSTNPADSLSCTEVYFSHGLSNVDVVQQQIAVEWQRLGFTPQRMGPAAFTRWNGPGGRWLVTYWGTTNTGPLAMRGPSLQITDCPR